MDCVGTILNIDRGENRKKIVFKSIEIFYLRFFKTIQDFYEVCETSEI